FNLADSLRVIESPDSAVYYAKIVSEHPRSYRVPMAKNFLTELHQPIPEPNPAALVQPPNAKNDEADEHKGILQKVFAGLLYRSPVSTDTSASAVTGSVLDKSDTKDDSGSGGSLQIENKPTKRPN